MAVVARVDTPRGELALRHDGEHYELISNGTFLMDTRGGQSERLLVSAALAAHPSPGIVLIGGLGVGFSLTQALADERVKRVVVAEIEPTLIDWHRTHLSPYTAGALSDPRARVVIGDIAERLRSEHESYDVICLDVDNGPDWTVTDTNAALYSDEGTAILLSRLRPGGVLSVWSAARSSSYEDLLRRHFNRVEMHEVAAMRGEPDVVIVATGPRATTEGWQP